MASKLWRVSQVGELTNGGLCIRHRCHVADNSNLPHSRTVVSSGMQVIWKCWAVRRISELTFRHFGLPLHLMAVVDGPGTFLRVLVSLGSGGPRAARDRHSRGLLRTPLRSSRIHLRGRCRIGSRNPRCKGGSRREIPR